MSDSAAAPTVLRTMRKFTEQERAQMVAESFVVGSSVTAVASRHSVSPTLLSYWRKLSRETGRTTKGAPVAKLAQVQISTPTSPRLPISTDGVIEIDLERQCVRVRGVVDAAMLREVLAQLR